MYPNQGYGQSPFGTGYPQSPPQPFGAGYPSAQMPMPSQPGYPPQQPGYPPQQSGYPQTQMPMPSQPQQYGYPPQQPGYPPQQQPSYPPQQPGYPPQQPGYPSQQPGYPSQQPTSPPQPFGSGYPPQQTAYQQQQPPQNQTYTPSATYPTLPTQEPKMQQQSFGSYQNSAPPQQYGQPAAYGQQPMGQNIARGRPTVVPAANFNASNDAAALRKAMKGFGTDEDAIIEVLCRRTNTQRMEIIRTYKTAYGKDLIDDIKSETSGNFESVLVALLTPTHEFYAKELYEAVCGAGTDEDVLIEVMCAMSNYEIRAICAYFQRLYGKSLENELRSDTSGNFKRLMTSLCCAGRDESMVTDVNQAKIDAQELKRAGIDKWGTDESAFNRVLCLRNYEQIKLIAREYLSLTGHPLEKDIKKEFSGDIEDGLLAILRVAENKPEFYAQRLHKSMAGLGTRDRSLIRLIVSRCEVDMLDIKEAFVKKYGKTLKSFIKGDTSGHYKHALYALIGENRS